jgi:hypothetical protein
LHVEQVVQPSVSSATLKVLPSVQALQAVSCVAAHAVVWPWPAGHVEQVVQPPVSSATLKVLPSVQVLQVGQAPALSALPVE